MGTLDIDTYVVDTLMPDLVGHDRQPAAFLVYLLLWRRCGSAGDGCAASLREISEGTGLSKRARRHLVEVERGGITAIPEYSVLRPWAVK
jgi:hypothetical protein